MIFSAVLDTQQTGLVRPPNPDQLMATSSTVVVTQDFPESANSPPTLAPGYTPPTGGIGKNSNYPFFSKSKSLIDILFYLATSYTV